MAKFKEISLEEAKRIQYDIQLYRQYCGIGAMDDSIIESKNTPECRRSLPHYFGDEFYWKGMSDYLFYVKIDDTKPEYEEETG